jgi:pimeloyl-ACP methyl ester carboxylesterase
MRDTIDIGVRGGTVRLRCAGAGVPILLLHGWSLDHRAWTPQIESLADRYRVITLDRRGFGASTAPPGLAAETGDILTILRRLDLDRAVLVGMSQGGRIALRFAVTHPQRVSGLVLQGAPLDGFAPEPRREDAIPLSSYRALAREGRLAQVRSLWGSHPLMRCAAPAASQLLDALLADYQGRDLIEPGPDNVAPLANMLADVPVPALVVTGEHDTPWRQLVGDALAYGLPHSRRARVSGAGHLCNLTHPQAFNALVAGFVDRIAAAPAGISPGSLQLQ